MTQDGAQVSRSDDDGPEAVGSVAEEAAKLFGVLSGWARDQGDVVSGAAAAMSASVGEGMQHHLATGSAECTWCPVCRAVGVVRQTSPEARAHLAAAASSLLLAATELLSTRVPSEGRGVEHIDLDEPGDWEADDGPAARTDRPGETR